MNMNLKKLNEIIEIGTREITLTEDIVIDDEKSLIRIKGDLTIDAPTIISSTIFQRKILYQLS